MEHEAFVFKPMKSRLTVLGLGGREWLVTVCIAAACALAAYGLGFWTHDVAVDVPAAEQSDQLSKLTDERRAMQRLDARTSAQGSREKAIASATESDQELISRAEKAGVESSMTDEELKALVTRQRVETQPVIPDIPRWFALFFAPTLTAAALQAELFRNSSIKKEVQRVVRNAAAQHEFRSDPNGFMEECEEAMLR